MSINICQRCGKQFSAGQKTAKYCTVACDLAAWVEQSKQKRASYSPERRAALIATARAITVGTLVRQSCEVCGSARAVDAHHDDYANPLDVRWLCRSHHQKHHAQHGPALNAYRAVSA